MRGFLFLKHGALTAKLFKKEHVMGPRPPRKPPVKKTTKKGIWIAGEYEAGA
jgi:hypothetical protein